MRKSRGFLKNRWEHLGFIEQLDSSDTRRGWSLGESFACPLRFLEDEFESSNGRQEFPLSFPHISSFRFSTPRFISILSCNAIANVLSYLTSFPVFLNVNCLFFVSCYQLHLLVSFSLTTCCSILLRNFNGEICIHKHPINMFTLTSK